MPILSDELLRMITPPVQVQLHPDLSSGAKHWDVFRGQPWQPSNTLALIQLGIAPFHWQAPATFPRLSRMQLFSKDVMWIIFVTPSRGPFVTVLDVCEGIFNHFNKNMGREEYHGLSPTLQAEIIEWY